MYVDTVSAMGSLPPGPFTRAQAESLGVSRAKLAAMATSGVVRQVLRGVYVDTHIADSVDLRVRAAALVVTPSHVVVDRTAAWLLGIDALSWAEHDALPPVEAIATGGNAPSRRSGVDAGSRDLGSGDVIRLRGITVTTPLRTSMDLGCRLKRREAYAVMNQFARLHSVGAAEIAPNLPRFRGRRGVIQMRELTQYLEPRLESPRESWLLLAILDANLPRPQVQCVVQAGSNTYRLDLAYARARVAVEYDGAEHHSSSQAALHDRQRRRELERIGWRFVVVRNGDFAPDRLTRWVGNLRELLTPTYRNTRW